MIVNMSKAAKVTGQEAHYKAQAEDYLAQARRILRQLATERRREQRRQRDRSKLPAEVKEILRAA